MTEEQAVDVLVKLGKKVIDRTGWFSEATMSPEQQKNFDRIKEAVIILSGDENIFGERESIR